MATGRIGTTPVLRTRWSKEPAGGTTSLSGLDDYSVSLVYEVGYEAVYQNGALLSRGNDYTATNGTTITLTNATVAGDIIEVFANNVVPLTDTYSQSVADGKFINNTLTTTTGDIIYASAANTPARLGIGSTGQVLKVSGGIPSWGTDNGSLVLISTTTFSAVTSQSFNNVFTSTYNNYVIHMTYHSSSNNRIFMRLRASGTDASGGNYFGAVRSLSTGAALTTEWAGAGSTAWEIGNEPTTSATSPNRVTMTMFYPAQTSSYKAQTHNFIQGDVAKGGYGWGGMTVNGTSYDGFTIYNGTGGATTITGTVSIYGVSK